MKFPFSRIKLLKYATVVFFLFTLIGPRGLIQYILISQEKSRVLALVEKNEAQIGFYKKSVASLNPEKAKEMLHQDLFLIENNESITLLYSTQEEN